MTATATQTFTILAADKLAQQGLDWINAQPDADLLNKPGLTEEEYGQMLSEGGIEPTIDTTFPLTADGAAAAHTYLHERRNFGKVVLVRDGI